MSKNDKKGGVEQDNKLPADVEITPTEVCSPDESALDTIIPENIRRFRDKFLKHTVPEFDQYGDGFVAQAYFAAFNSSTGTNFSIANALGLDTLTFQYYMQKYADFATAVNMGKLDARQNRLADLQSSLLARAIGVEVEETRTEDSGSIDEDGNFKTAFRKIVTTKKQIPPDAAAAIAILGKIDPSWNPKTTLEINFNKNLNVTEDVNINVDLRSLSPDALKELLGSQKQSQDMEINKTPEGQSVRFLGEKGDQFRAKSEAQPLTYEPKPKEVLEPGVTRVRKPMSIETKKKISEALKKRNQEKKNGDKN